LVVIAIIALLSSVVLASLNSARAKARDAKRLQDINSIRTALELYASDHSGSFPNINAAELTTPNWTLFVNTLVSGGYMSEVPADPTLGGSYQYVYEGSPGVGYGCEGTADGIPILYAETMETGSKTNTDPCNGHYASRAEVGFQQGYLIGL
jgi:type II secretory pathway pseudopilin PulG